jgi:hypothetical protein
MRIASAMLNIPSIITTRLENLKSGKALSWCEEQSRSL